MKIKQALLSVSDKTGIVTFAQALLAQGVQLLSTGGTAKLLLENGLPVTEVGEYTGFPEMLDGRVKTLHPKIHGGILARRGHPEHMDALKKHGIDTIDMVVVNLYPFEATIKQPNCSLDTAIEQIDIGGPAMLRSSAKNHQDVVVICDPTDYTNILKEITDNQGTVSRDTRFYLAKKVFAHTAHYDSAIAAYLNSTYENTPAASTYPSTLHIKLHKQQDLRYGENPHQTAAFYCDEHTPPDALSHYQQLQGKTLSYNNIADADAAWECVKSLALLGSAACVIVKHANPCGAALGKSTLEAYQKAWQTDPTSAFGGIIAFNAPLDETTAAALLKQFVEVIIAPDFTLPALALLKEKPNIRVLQVPLTPASTELTYDYKRVGGGLLVQSADKHILKKEDLNIVTKRVAPDNIIDDMLFAWQVAQYVKSNAIVFCANGMTLGIGAGQMSRIDSARIAAIKAQEAHLSLQNAVVASDAFFPFRDGLDAIASSGAAYVVQPGGSLRDQEVIDAANEHGIVMAFTGVRHFRH